MTPRTAAELHDDLVARGVISPPAETAGPANDNDNDNDFDAEADAWASVLYCYDVIRKRMRAGGPGWEPK